MSRFYVGQRVRLVRCRNAKWANGREATIVARASVHIGLHWRIRVDGVPGPLGGGWETLERHLEPPTDSYDVVRWEGCVWKPEHLRADV